jgi:hypothetical protein
VKIGVSGPLEPTTAVKLWIPPTPVCCEDRAERLWKVAAMADLPLIGRAAGTGYVDESTAADIDISARTGN